jgi:hypothetical protein
MLEFIDFWESARAINVFLLSFAFFVGIMLLVSREAFTRFESDLQKEYGLKQRLVPTIEQPGNKCIDWFLLRYRFLSGIIISVSAFILLLFSR